MPSWDRAQEQECATEFKELLREGIHGPDLEPYLPEMVTIDRYTGV